MEKQKEIDRLFTFILRHSFEDIKCLEIWSDEKETRIDIATCPEKTVLASKFKWDTFSFSSGNASVMQFLWPIMQQYVRDFKEKDFMAKYIKPV